jgi:NADH:ubiquinone oxidoreductase subunit 5 (subunit L)/multisubunit Na+/H+ antiporter MnhA subunit
VLFLFAAPSANRVSSRCVWLPDAMEGPPPVSALIHAATMVVAGGMVARMFPLFAGGRRCADVVTALGLIILLQQRWAWPQPT